MWVCVCVCAILMMGCVDMLNSFFGQNQCIHAYISITRYTPNTYWAKKVYIIIILTIMHFVQCCLWIRIPGTTIRPKRWTMTLWCLQLVKTVGFCLHGKRLHHTGANLKSYSFSVAWLLAILLFFQYHIMNETIVCWLILCLERSMTQISIDIFQVYDICMHII